MIHAIIKFVKNFLNHENLTSISLSMSARSAISSLSWASNNWLSSFEVAWRWAKGAFCFWCSSRARKVSIWNNCSDVVCCSISCSARRSSFCLCKFT